MKKIKSGEKIIQVIVEPATTFGLSNEGRIFVLKDISNLCAFRRWQLLVDKDQLYEE